MLCHTFAPKGSFTNFFSKKKLMFRVISSNISRNIDDILQRFTRKSRTVICMRVSGEGIRLKNSNLPERTTGCFLLLPGRPFRSGSLPDCAPQNETPASPVALSLVLSRLAQASTIPRIGRCTRCDTLHSGVRYHRQGSVQPKQRWS